MTSSIPDWVEQEEYEDALQDAHDADLPWFSIEEWRARCRALAKPPSESEPAPEECPDEDIPF